MKRLFLFVLSATGLSHVWAQDTLKNHTGTVTLQAGRYTGSDWGFFAGHNSKEQQQFGEKYLVDDHVHVLGVVAHITTSTGAVKDRSFEIDFRLWKADVSTGKPAGTASIEDGHLDLGDANLGGPTVIMFHDETHIDDAFFVTMDLGDYAHDGLAGDTVGLYYAPHGTRTAADIASVPFRNVFQAHSHGAPNWKDFYTQFTTPSQIATHLALYPIVEMEAHTGIASISKNGLQVMSPYPNPAGNEITFPFHLKKPADVDFNIMDLSGRIIKVFNRGLSGMGEQQQKMDISDLPSGTYILSIVSSEGSLGMKFSKI